MRSGLMIQGSRPTTSAGIINWNTLAGTKQIEKNVECISLLKQNAKNVKTSTPKILEICSAIGWRRPNLLSYSFIAAKCSLVQET